MAACTLDASEIQISPDAPEDSESWLEVDPQELDAMLAKTSGRPAQRDPDGDLEVDGEDGEALQDLARKVEDFVGGQGDLQGARFLECVLSLPSSALADEVASYRMRT